MKTLAPVLIGALSAIIAAFGTYMVARRKSSGRIATTEAATLWAESQAMRKELRDEVVALRVENSALRAEMQTLREEMNELKRKVGP